MASNELRIVVVKDGPWWLRYRWAVETRYTRRGRWMLKKSGRACSLEGAWDKALRRGLILPGHYERIEARVLAAAPARPPRPEPGPTPLPPELLRESD